MRTPQAWAPLLAALAFSLAAHADEPWHKPASEWNEKEVRAILEKSPWAHRDQVLLTKPKMKEPPCPPGSLRCFSDDTISYPTPGPRRKPASPDDLNEQQTKRAENAEGPSSDAIAGTTVVRWASASTVREAMARRQTKPETVAVVSANEPPPLPPSVAYIVYVDLRVHLHDIKRLPRSGVFTRAMAQNAVLVMKKTGERIPALRVRSAPLPDFDQRKELAIAAFYVYFPREKDGNPVIAAGETGVHFECPLYLGPITSDFDLHKMKRDGAPDL